MSYLLGLLAISVIAFLSVVAFVLWVGLRDDLRKVDVAVVLGNHVHSGGEPSPRLAARLDRAIDLYRKELFPTVLVSGGISSSGADEVVTMAGYLRAAGVPEAAIRSDPGGVNTAATARNSAQWMRANDARSVLVISQYFHITRIRLAFRQNAVTDIAHAHGYYLGWRDPYLLMREVAALVRYAVRGG